MMRMRTNNIHIIALLFLLLFVVFYSSFWASKTTIVFCTSFDAANFLGFLDGTKYFYRAESEFQRF